MIAISTEILTKSRRLDYLLITNVVRMIAINMEILTKSQRFDYLLIKS